MTNRQVLTTAIMIMAISMSIAGTQNVFANGEEPENNSIWCDAFGDIARGGVFSSEGVCELRVDELEIDDEFDVEISGTLTILGDGRCRDATVELTIFIDDNGREGTITVEAEGDSCRNRNPPPPSQDGDFEFTITSGTGDFDFIVGGSGELTTELTAPRNFAVEIHGILEVEIEEEIPTEGDCSRQYENPIITSIVPTIDGAEITWIQDQKKFFFWCFDPREFSVESGSYFEDHISGDNHGSATITGLECGTEYDVTVSTDWIFHSDTTDTDSYETLACDFVEEEEERGGGGDDRHKTSPTSGNDWNTFENLVEGGITVDRVSFTLTDNWYTPFEQIQIETGSTHTFGVKTFAVNGGLMVQEIAFGIPEVGYYQDAESLVEVHYDWDKTILELVVVQDTDVLNVLSVSTDQVLCRSESDAICYQTNLTIKFNEPLKDQVYAVKAFDMTRRSMMPHYFNEGINIFGDSLNPMLTMQIASTEKYEGLILITQTEKYSNLWIAEDGRIFDSDNLYTQTNKVIQKGYNDARGSPVQQMNLDGQAYLASQLYFDSSKIQGTDGGFIAPAVDTDGDHREQTLQQLVSYNAN